MLKKIINQVVSAFAIFFASNTAAQETSNRDSSEIEFNSYFEFYYQASEQGHIPSPAPAAGPEVLEGRVFDRHSNQATLNMVEVSLKKKFSKTSVRADFAFGEMVDQLSGGGSQSVTGTGVGQNPTNPAANESTRNLTQAILTYAASEKLTFNIGKYFSHMGYEVTKAKDNWQFSRSLTFNYGIPFWHEGINGTYKFIPEKLSATVHLLNGWEGRVSQEQNQTSTVGVNINFALADELSGNYNFIGGAETTDASRREVHEINLTYVLNPAFSFAVDHLVGTQKNVTAMGDARWQSLSLYALAMINEFYSISPRYEIFDDSDKGFAISGGLAAAGTRQKITSWTFSNNFNLDEGLQVRLEFRSDKSDSDQYFKNKKGMAETRQESYTAAVLYAF